MLASKQKNAGASLNEHSPREFKLPHNKTTRSTTPSIVNLTITKVHHSKKENMSYFLLIHNSLRAAFLFHALAELGVSVPSVGTACAHSYGDSVGASFVTLAGFVSIL